MVDQKIIDYIRDCRAKDIPDQQITLNLKSSGWDEAMIHEAFVNLPMNQSTNGAQTNSASPAGSWGRFWAFVIDNLLFGLFVLALSIVLSTLLGSPIPANGNITDTISSSSYAAVIAVISLSLYLIYFVYFTAKKGATIGKAMYGFKVVKYQSNQQPSILTACKRELFKILYFLPLIGSLLYFIVGLSIIFAKDKRGLADHLAGTQELAVTKAWSMKRQIPFFVGMIIGFFLLIQLNSFLYNISSSKKQTNSSADNLQTYTDKVDGWSIMYDSSKIEAPFPGSPPRYSTIDFGPVSGQTSCGNLFEVETINNPSNLPAQQLYSSFQTNPQMQNTVVNGMNGVKVTDIANASSFGGEGNATIWTAYLIPAKNEVFILRYGIISGSTSYTSSECEQSMKVFNQMVQSFKTL